MEGESEHRSDSKAQCETNPMPELEGATALTTSDIKVVYKLRDRKEKMVEAWKKLFDKYPERFQISKGDIFKGAPSADALVSPANSFGFMDGGIDMTYSIHFGWQMQERLQERIRKEKDGELLVGDAIIMTTFEDGYTEAREDMDWSLFNEEEPIKFLISAPTMRIPCEVSDTVNAYLAFRAVILAVKKHNRNPENETIRSVLLPGLGTAVGRMPEARCAYQMLKAFETYELGLHSNRLHPDDLYKVYIDHEEMAEYCFEEDIAQAAEEMEKKSKAKSRTMPTS